MLTIKKIVLFLFGIVLIVFGNKAAINTIFKSEENNTKDKTTQEEETAKSKPVVTEELPTPLVEEKVDAEVDKPRIGAPSQKRKDKEKEEIKQTKTDSLKEEKDKVVEEKAATIIEQESAEPASATY